MEFARVYERQLIFGDVGGSVVGEVEHCGSSAVVFFLSPTPWFLLIIQQLPDSSARQGVRWNICFSIVSSLSDGFGLSLWCHKKIKNKKLQLSCKFPKRIEWVLFLLETKLCSVPSCHHDVNLKSALSLSLSIASVNIFAKPTARTAKEKNMSSNKQHCSKL